MTKLPQLDNDSCLAALRSGDDHVLHAMIDAFEPGIVQFLKRKGASPAEAREIFFLSLQTLYEAAQTPDFVLTNCRGFLGSVAWKQWLKECRRKKKTAGQVTPEELGVYIVDYDTVIDQLLDQVEQRNLVWEYIDRMSDSCQQLLRLAIQEQYSYEEIARELNYSDAESARQQKFKCQKKLKDLIRKDPRYQELRFNEKV